MATIFTHASIDFDSPRENLSAKELFLFHKQLQEALNEAANKVLDSFGIIANSPGNVVELSAPFQVGSEDIYEDFTEADLTAEVPPAKEEFEPILTPQDFRISAERWDGAMFFATQSDNKEEVKRAWEAVSLEEKRMEASPYTMDENDNVILKS